MAKGRMLMVNDLAKIIGLNHDIVLYDVPLSSRTWLHRGGNAGVYFTPQTYDEMVLIGKYLYAQKAKFDIIGHSSNIYFLNTYCTDYVIDTKKWGG